MAQLPIRIATIVFLVLTTSARSAAPQAVRPQVFQQMMACRQLTIAADRLACFDRESERLDTAERSRDVVIVDREQVRAARRSLFGLTLPSLALFGGDRSATTADGRAEALESDQVETTIQAASQTATGRWVIVLADGARWVQTDERRLSADPRTGQPIRIRRAAMGSFLANVNRQIAIRVRREN